MPFKKTQKNIKYTSRRVFLPSAQDPTQASTSRGNATAQQPSSNSSDSSESDDDWVPESSPKHQNHVEQLQEDISGGEEVRLVSDCAFYLLVADQRKYAIKKPDIIKYVFKEHKKLYKKVMEKVETYLMQVFGMKLLELEGRKGQFILVNELKAARNFAEGSKDEKIIFGLLMMVLGTVFMMEDHLPESELWKMLKKAGIDPDTKHVIFGDVKKLLTQEFVRQLYLEYKKEDSHPPAYIFSWGPRAKFEIPKLEVLQYVCNIYGNNITPQQWPTQYNDAMKSAGTTEQESAGTNEQEPVEIDEQDSAGTNEQEPIEIDEQES